MSTDNYLEDDEIAVKRDQWERIAAVVRAAVTEFGLVNGDPGHPFDDALDALTPDDIEAVQP